MFSKLKLKNFQSWGELEISIKAGVLLLDGWNEDDGVSEGSGKSAFPNAICWGAYGKIPKDLNIDDVIRENQKECEVELFFDDGFRIVRSRSSKRSDLYYVLPNSTEKIRRASIVETQKDIVNYLGISYEGFIHTIYHPQTRTSSFVSSGKEGKMQILTELISLTIFDKARKETEDRIKGEKKKNETLNITLLENQKDVVALEGTIALEEQKEISAKEKAKTDLNIAAQNLALVDLEITHLSDRVKRREEQQANDLSLLTETLISAKADVVLTDNELKQFQFQLTCNSSGNISSEEKPFWTERILELTTKKALLVANIASNERKEREITRYDADLQKFNNDLVALERFIENPTKICPTCSTKLPNQDVSHAEKEVLNLKKRMASIKASELQVKSELVDVSKAPSELGESLIFCQSQVDALDRQTTSVQELKTKIKFTEHKLIAEQKRVNEAIAKLEDHKKAKLDSLEELLEPLVLKKDLALIVLNDIKDAPLAFTPDILKKTIKKLNTQRGIAKSLTSDILKNTKLAGDLTKLKLGFRDVKSYVFESFLRELNAKIDNYLCSLFDISVSYVLVRDGRDLATKIKMNGEERKLGSLSGGQEKRVSLAVDLALHDLLAARLGTKWGLLVMDEYFQGLSEISMEKCLDLLQLRDQAILLIEHNSIFKSIITNEFKVLLKDGVSRAAK